MGDAPSARKPEALQQSREPRYRRARGRGRAQAARIDRFVTIAAAAAALLAAGCTTSPAHANVPAHVILADASRQLSRSTSVAIRMELGAAGSQGPSIRADLTMRTAPDKAMTANITAVAPNGSVYAVLREILFNKVFYLSAKVFAPGVSQDILIPWAAPGKTWTAVPVSRLNQASGNTQNTSLAQLNPMSLFHTTFAAISAAKDTSVVGSQVIDGVPTTHLHGTARDHGAVATFDLWVDAKDRPRELRVSPQNGTITFYFRSFNQPVSIAPPPAREVGPPKPGYGL